MKINTILILFIIFIGSCALSENEINKNNKEKKTEKNDALEIEILSYDIKENELNLNIILRNRSDDKIKLCYKKNLDKINNESPFYIVLINDSKEQTLYNHEQKSGMHNEYTEDKYEILEINSYKSALREMQSSLIGLKNGTYKIYVKYKNNSKYIKDNLNNFHVLWNGESKSNIIEVNILYNNMPDLKY